VFGGILLELDRINQDIANYLASQDEAQMLHNALKKQNTHLLWLGVKNADAITTYLEKHRLSHSQVLLCADVSNRAELFSFLLKAGWKNFLLLNQAAKEINYTYLNFLIFAQREKFVLKPATYDSKNNYKVPEVESYFKSHRTPTQVQQRFSIVYNELVMNAILHAGAKTPELSFSAFSDYLIFRIRDKAGTFDFENLTKVFDQNQLAVNPGNTRTAGIGPNMVLMYAEGLHFKVTRGIKTEVTFFINFNKSLRYCGFFFL
jgi:anti-sigma regulatory factor (Ser/Thr protein kinase)